MSVLVNAGYAERRLMTKNLLFSLVLLFASFVGSTAYAETGETGPGTPTEEPVGAKTEEPLLTGAEEKAGTEEKAEEKKVRATEIGLFGRPVRRGGFHLQIGFGVGGGPDTLGIFHTMELGYSFGKHTVGMLHTFIQNRNTFGTDLGGPDLIGGWMLEYKHTLFFPDLEWKVALGLGGTHDQGGGKIHANPGFGASYGIDLHFPVWPRFGPTLTLAGMNVTAENRHHFGAGLALGVTLF